MTPDNALTLLWHVASNAVLVAGEGHPPQGMTHDDHAALQQARATLARVIEQWTATMEASSHE